VFTDRLTGSGEFDVLGRSSVAGEGPDKSRKNAAPVIITRREPQLPTEEEVSHRIRTKLAYYHRP
jgi:hypothetical protein